MHSSQRRLVNEKFPKLIDLILGIKLEIRELTVKKNLCLIACAIPLVNVD